MKVKYISSEVIQARVREELRTYFYAGAIDDLMFNTWVADCIDKFEYTYLPIKECAMDMWNNRCELPCDFKAVREVWMCATFFKGPIVSPHVFYYQTDCRIGSAPTPADSCSDCLIGDQCFPPSQTPTPLNLPSLCDVPAEFIVTHKVMQQLNFSFRVTGMLKPGNFRTIDRCHEGCPNRDVWCVDTFDIVGNSLHTSFREGTIYLAYYASKAEQDETGYYLISDNDPFQKYVYYYLRFMVFQQMFDQSIADDFNQARAKRDDAEKRMWDSYQNAKAYAVSDDIYGLEKRIVRSYNKNNKFLLR
jgi:hypothetical protein